MTTTLRKTLLSASILAALSFTGAAVAQEAAPPASTEATDLDAIVVVGIRGSLEKSLNTKRDAGSRVEAVSAEDIGKLPAKNVADTLQQLPGVNISSSSATEGGFDEADRVSLRGTNPSLTQTLVNGHGVGTGDWFVLSQVANVGRSVSYSLFPAEIVDQVVVHKSSEAKLVEGGSAGSVNIITRKPLQYTDKFTASASVGAVHADLPDKTDPQLSALFNWKNDADTAGVLLQAFYQKRHLRRDGQEVVGGYGQIGYDAPVTETNPDLAGVYYPNLLGAVLFEQKRERKGGSIDIQVKPSDNLTLGLNGFYSKLEADNYNRNYMMWGSQFVNVCAPDAGYTVNNGVLTHATYGACAPNPDDVTPFGVYDMISRPGASSSTHYVTFDADWWASDSLQFKFQAGTTKGKGSSPTQDVLETGLAPDAGASWSMRGIRKAIDWSLGGDNTAATHLPNKGWIFGGQGIEVIDKEDWFSADGTVHFFDGVLASLDFGLRHARHERRNDYEIAQGPNWATDWTNIANYPTSAGRYPGNFGNGLGGQFPGGIWYYTPEQLKQINEEFANRSFPERFYFSDVYSVEERSSAAYVQANFAGDRWSGNLGLRYVRTESDIGFTQALPVDSGIPGAITGSAFGDYLPVTVDNDYNKLLPSANFKYDVTEDMVLRLAASQTMTRPDFSALAGSLSLADLTHTGSGGNPLLKPLVSTNFDVSWEWYFAPRALLSVSLFSMDLKDYITFGTETIQYKDQAASHEAGTDIYADYDVSIPVNMDGKLTGFEIAYQQPIGEYFGVAANYTRANGDLDDGKPLNGASRNTWNVSGYFENEQFNARLSYTFREAFFAGVSRTDAFYQDDFGTLSASLGYKINDSMSLSLDGLNLNNPKYSYYTETPVGVQQYAMYSNGRQYYLTFRWKY